MTRAMLHNRLAMRNRTALPDIDFAFHDQGQAGRDFARLHDQCSIRKMPALAEALQARDVMIVQMRKHLVAAGIQKRGCITHNERAYRSARPASSLNLPD